jgi:hypothetical protein
MRSNGLGKNYKIGPDQVLDLDWIVTIHICKLDFFHTGSHFLN